MKGPSYFKMIADGKRGATGNLISEHQVPSRSPKFICANSCHKQEKCLSFAVNEQDRMCKLYNQKWVTNQNDLITDSKYMVFDKKMNTN